MVKFYLKANVSGLRSVLAWRLVIQGEMIKILSEKTKPNYNILPVLWAWPGFKENSFTLEIGPSRFKLYSLMTPGKVRRKTSFSPNGFHSRQPRKQNRTKKWLYTWLFSKLCHCQFDMAILTAKNSDPSWLVSLHF